jgi:hypothetical protein
MVEPADAGGRAFVGPGPVGAEASGRLVRLIDPADDIGLGDARRPGPVQTEHERTSSTPHRRNALTVTIFERKVFNTPDGTVYPSSFKGMAVNDLRETLYSTYPPCDPRRKHIPGLRTMV